METGNRMRIYTGQGDTGETGLYGGQRVPKDDARVEAYGTVDEANALLGVAATHLADDTELRDLVLDLQRELFTVGSDLATPLERDARAGKAVVPRITPAHVKALEHIIDRYEETLTPLRQFILPGGTPAAAALHHARTVCRRAERRVVTLHRDAPDTMNAETLRYLNRLADLLFVVARAANRRAGVEDIPWTRAERVGSGEIGK
jgi:cob(I)alamin adenosyltransferase